VGVFVGTLVGGGLTVSVTFGGGGVFVGFVVGVSVGVFVGVSVGLTVGVLVTFGTGVLVALTVGFSVGVSIATCAAATFMNVPITRAKTSVMGSMTATKYFLFIGCPFCAGIHSSKSLR
jgi:hypothetical protein